MKKMLQWLVIWLNSSTVHNKRNFENKYKVDWTRLEKKGFIKKNLGRIGKRSLGRPPLS